MGKDTRNASTGYLWSRPVSASDFAQLAQKSLIHHFTQPALPPLVSALAIDRRPVESSRSRSSDAGQQIEIQSRITLGV